MPLQRVAQQLMDAFDIEPAECLRVSAKTGGQCRFPAGGSFAQPCPAPSTRLWPPPNLPSRPAVLRSGPVQCAAYCGGADASAQGRPVGRPPNAALRCIP